MPAWTRAVLTCRARSQEDDDALSADKFIQKAGFLLSESKDEALELQYNTCYARILDSKARPPRGSASAGWLAHLRRACFPRCLQRKFIEAALRYYHLSQLAKREIGASSLAAAWCHASIWLVQRVAHAAPRAGGRVVAEEELMMALNAAVR